MRISVITPTFNSAATIARNVRSVRAQTHENREQVFIDNCSVDGTRAIVADLYRADGRDGENGRYRFLSSPDLGIADAFNKGIRESSGDVIAILNSDDYFATADALGIVAECFANEKIDFVYGDILFSDPVLGSQRRRPPCCPLTRGMPYYHPAFFTRRRLYDEVGEFCVDYRYGMDYEWVCRLYKTKSEPAFSGLYVDNVGALRKSEAHGNGALVVMSAGGASTVNERNLIDEMERALRAHHFWDLEGVLFQNARRCRVRLKKMLIRAGWNWVIRSWRAWRYR
jgi:glycosyltransferase involved in cell wall biosynthesis